MEERPVSQSTAAAISISRSCTTATPLLRPFKSPGIKLGVFRSKGFTHRPISQTITTFNLTRYASSPANRSTIGQQAFATTLLLLNKVTFAPKVFPACTLKLNRNDQVFKNLLPLEKRFRQFFRFANFSFAEM